jgi:fido (protein-threonine AMPylation protein)
MATPNERLAQSLIQLRKLQEGGQRVFQSQQLSRVYRERLIKNGFLQEVMKGWLISTSPTARDGESTPWYASFWEFCARYCSERFTDDWCLSPEQSLLLHAERTVIPAQVIVQSPKAMNHKISLPFGTSLFDLKQPKMPLPADLTVRDGLRLYTPEAALVRIPESFMATHAIEVRAVMGSLRDAGNLLRHLLGGGHSIVAGRLAAAFRRIGRAEIAKEILTTMKSAGYDIREVDPFAGNKPLGPIPVNATPIVARMQSMWESMRTQVLQVFPPAPGRPKSGKVYLRVIDEIYSTDAYHSLSIEGYRVSDKLIERVKAGNWNPDRNEPDRQDRDALAARGYWQCFQSVKEDISLILRGENPGRIVREAHRDWYRELFQPCVTAGVIQAVALAGYRNDAVYLRTSRYVPPRWETLRDGMPALFDLLENEPEPAVRAVLGHWLFGYLHPYPDGNGRIARFLMNAMLAAGGYPWAIVQVEERAAYLHALDRASVDLDIVPFARFLASCVKRAMIPGFNKSLPLS